MIRGKITKKNMVKAYEARLVPAIAAALYQEAESIMTAAKDGYIPIKTGALRRSAHVVPPKIQGSKITVTLAAGGPSAPYAYKVHEAPPTWGQGKNKYLEKPVLAAKRGFGKRLAARASAGAGFKVGVLRTRWES